MKTKILGLAAIIIAISASAFTNPNKHVKSGTGPYWFLVTSTVAKGNHAVKQADASFLQQSPTAPTEPSTICPSGNTNQCVSGFDAGQVDTMTDELIDDNEISLHQSQLRN
ncbi:MAG: hypothetical protein JST19_12480 [Bacteroidetes bacterium]|nr:hypothetical protein [Bacteroidota bacterium]